jgi:hypothetical protein
MYTFLLILMYYQVPTQDLHFFRLMVKIAIRLDTTRKQSLLITF